MMGNESIEEYDIIFIGSPNWFKTIAPPVLSFLRKHDFSNKAIIPFCTHGGGGFGKIEETIKIEAKNANFLPGFAGTMDTKTDEVEVWLKKIKFLKDKDMSETLRIIKDRFSCRSFTDKMPTDEDLKLIAEAGTQAPSGMDRQGWHIAVVKNKELISAMEEEGMRILEAMDKTMYENIMSRGGKVFYNAPCMIMISIKEATPRGAEMIDCGILAQTMVLAAESLGLNTLHCGFAGLSFAGTKREEFIKRLDFPEGYQPGMAILLGYTDNPTSAHIPNPDKISIIE